MAAQLRLLQIAGQFEVLGHGGDVADPRSEQEFVGHLPCLIWPPRRQQRRVQHAPGVRVRHSSGSDCLAVQRERRLRVTRLIQVLPARRRQQVRGVASSSRFVSRAQSASVAAARR